MLRLYISRLYPSCHDHPSLLSVLDLRQLCFSLVFVQNAFAIYRFDVVVICKIDHLRSTSSFTIRTAQPRAPSASSGMRLSIALVDYRLPLVSNYQNPLLYIPSLLFAWSPHEPPPIRSGASPCAHYHATRCSSTPIRATDLPPKSPYRPRTSGPVSTCLNKTKDSRFLISSNRPLIIADTIQPDSMEPKFLEPKVDDPPRGLGPDPLAPPPGLDGDAQGSIAVLLDTALEEYLADETVVGGGVRGGVEAFGGRGWLFGFDDDLCMVVSSCLY
jgi:hypothetical protein